MNESLQASAQRGTWYADPAHFQPRRRDILRVGWLGGVGLTLGNYFELTAHAGHNAQEPKAKNVIHIYLQGGFAHMDSFDPKPDAPAEYRGILGTVKTNVPGVLFSSHMQSSAKIADKIAVVRSMTHTEVDHSRGEHSMFTGYRPSPALVYPSMGSVVAHELGPRGAMPPYVVVPNQGSQFLSSGYLSNAYGPFALGGDPARRGFTVRDLNLPEGVSENRFERRKSWKSLVDEHFATSQSDDKLDTMNSFYGRAYELLASRESKEAFSLDRESDETKKLYGMEPWGPVLRPRAGASFLTARRLISQ